ncbi:MAG: vWA domain-containing protein [Lysobacterales bacterium]
MEGDAVAQSRAAISAVADQLGDEDRIQVLRFGSMTLPLFRRPLQASVRVRAALAELSGTIDADLGGTDIGTALEHAIDALAALPAQPGRSRAIVLVTDGAVQPHAIEAAWTNARKAGIRIFVVAVGSSAGADVLAPLATGTAGVLERAVPAEPIDEAVTRQLQRAREAGPAAIAIDWSHRKARPLPIDPAYAGDAVTATRMLPGNRSFEVEVRVDGESVIRNLRLADVEDAPALRAIAGQAAWWHALPRPGKLALQYGLVTDETAAVLVKVRADGQKVEGPPVVVPVAHMVPGGHGDFGSDVPRLLLRR